MIFADIQLVAFEKERDYFCVHFDDKNYPTWDFQFKNYAKEKGIWSHLNDVSKTLIEKTTLDAWEIKNAQIITWVLSIVDPHMINNMHSFSTTQEIWNYLIHIFNQNNADKSFKMEVRDR